MKYSLYKYIYAIIYDDGVVWLQELSIHLTSQLNIKAIGSNISYNGFPVSVSRGKPFVLAQAGGR